REFARLGKLRRISGRFRSLGNWALSQMIVFGILTLAVACLGFSVAMIAATSAGRGMPQIAPATAPILGLSILFTLFLCAGVFGHAFATFIIGARRCGDVRTAVLDD